MHTTVHRELFVLPGGGLLIDTPGIRELQLWGTEAALDQNFDDIAWLASQCMYTTCQHNAEPGCAVQQALRDGTLTTAHYASYRQMKAELATLKQKHTAKMQQANKKSPKHIARQNKEREKEMLEELS